MRKKIFIGVFVAAVASIVAGDFVFNRGGAQDAPKKAEEKKGDLFDVLQKDLNAKKDVPPPVAPPGLVMPPGLVIPKDAPPTFPASVQPKDAPPTFPPVPAPKDNGTLAFPPLTKPESAPSTIQPPPVVNGSPHRAASDPVLPRVVNSQPPGTAVPPPPVTTTPQPVAPKIADPKPPQELVFPPVPKGTNVNPPDDSTNRRGTGTTIDFPEYANEALKTVSGSGSVTPTVPLPKDCPWSLQVDMADGQTTVIATVNKKHEFKIVCKSLDLQTAKGTLKASGKVTITGDAFNGTCEQLAIPLMEDRLVLEGGAAVTIQKIASTVSDTKPAAFELKGETLNLRISELQPERFLQTSMRKPVDVGVKQASTTATIADKQWTPYGTLRRVNTYLGNDNGVWQLEDRSGKVIATVLARVGGTLTQHEGQTISVIGATEVIDGRRYLRVTHIALP